MKAFLRRLAGFSVGSFVTAVISVVQVPILTFFLTQGDYGIFSFYRTMLLQVPGFLCLGLDQAFIREYYTVDDKRQVLQHAMLFPLLASCLFAVGCFLFAPQISQWIFGNPDERLFVWIGGIWCVAGVFERFFFLLLRMREEALLYSKVAIEIKVVSFVITLGLVFLGMTDYAGPVIGLLAGNLLIDALLVWRFRHMLDMRSFVRDSALMHRMLRYAWPLLLLVALAAGLNSVDSIFLNHFATKADLGVYNVGRNIVNVLSLITTTFANFWIATAFRWHDEDRSMAHFSYVSDALLAVLTLIYFGILIASPLLDLILGPGYEQAKWILGLLSLRLILSALSETTYLGMMFQRRTEYNLLVSLLTFLPSLLINWLLTSRIGFRGAALAVALSYFVFYLARTGFSRKCGFIIPQYKQILTSLLMIAVGMWMAMQAPWTGLVVAGGLLLCLFIQRDTLTQTLDIRRHPEKWKFD